MRQTATDSERGAVAGGALPTKSTTAGSPNVREAAVNRCYGTSGSIPAEPATSGHGGQTVAKIGAEAISATGRALRRVPRVEGDVAYIGLTKGHTAIIDALDLPLIGNWNWGAEEISGHVYARRNKTIAEGSGGLFMHRAILPTDMRVDHINGDTLDNRRCNLRPCTHQQNMQNQKLRASRLGARGVELVRGTYYAKITHDAIVYRLGGYPSLEEARAAYIGASLILYGEFAPAANGK